MDNVKFYVLSLLHSHALAVTNETETTLTIQKLKTISTINEFNWKTETIICVDETYQPRIEEKNDLSKVLHDVELTTDYWRVYEYMTGIKRKAVAESTES